MKREVEYYTKNRKVYHYVPTDAERKAINEQHAKMLFARRKAEKEAQAKYELEHSKGYCTKCFMLKPLTGICPTCD